MKKTLIALLALGGCVFAEDYTLTTTHNANYNVTYYGFYLNLSEHVKYTDASITDNLTENVVLKSLKLSFAQNNNALGNSFQFVVLDNSSSKVLGYSTTVETVVNNKNTTYEFVSADGVAPLTLSSTETYRYLAVSSSVISTIAGDTTKNYIYKGDTETSVTSTTTEEGIELTGGLMLVSGRAYADAVNSYSDALYIAGTDGISTSKVANYNVHVVATDIKVSTVTPAVPEPTTATLSLLALAGLAARRRRR